MMKLTRIITIAAMAALFAWGCKPAETDHQIDETLIYREFSANIGEDGTKTSMNGTSVLWDESGESIAIVDESGEFWSLEQTGVSADRKTATFAGNVPDKKLLYAIYPDNDDIEYSSGCLTLEIPSYQKAVENTFDTYTNITVAKVTDGEPLLFKNIGGMIGITVNADNIKSARIIATEASGNPLTGPVLVEYGVNDDAPVILPSEDDGYDYVELWGGLESGKKYWALVAPGEYTALSVVFTHKDGRTATFARQGSYTLQRRHAASITPFTITEKDWDDYVEPDDEFTLVKDVTDLHAGDEVLIVYVEGKKALSTPSSDGKYRTGVDISISGETIASAQDATVLTLEDGAGNGTWAFKDGSDYLASQSAAKNYLVNSSTLTDNASWTVSIDSDGLATIKANAGERCYLSYNVSDPRFSCYKDMSQKAVSIFRRGASGSGGHPAMRVNVTTGAASSITTFGATLSGSWNNANATVREAGFHIGTSPSDYSVTYQADITPGTSGSFYVNLTTLDPHVTYYYSAYVVLQDDSKIQEFTGQMSSFTTGTQPDVPHAGSQPGWFELPVMDIQTSGQYMINSTDNSQYFAWHISPDVKGPGGKYARNYTVCYSATYHCPVWVAAPRHSMYVGSSGRTDAYGKDPDIPSDIQYSSKSTGGGCNKGHMLGSAERTCSKATNRQVFYYTNIAPQLSSGFNTGGGGWNTLEDYVDTQVCADTLYEVLGCYFKRYTDAYGFTQNPTTISFGGRNDVAMPTMFYYVLLRTKDGSTGKSVANCTAEELKCVAFVRSHSNGLKGQAVTSRELMTVSDLEKITGVTYFPNVPNAPKNTFKASDWGL